MPFKKAPQTYSASINEVTIGTGDSAITLGGENVMPLYSFDAEIANRPCVGVEIVDGGVDKTLPGVAAFYEGADTVVEQAKLAANMPGADFVAIRLESSDPNGADTPIEESVELCKQVAEAIDKPLCIEGSKNIEKDEKLFEALAQALTGHNVLLMSAREENYKGIAASAGMAYPQRFSAESSVDINLAKQLNVLITQLGVQPASFVMNLGSAAAGYGFEYVVSTMDRVRAAALEQGDTTIQMPIITPVASETWGVKESVAEESEVPDWGPREDRGIQMEITTAAADLASGSNAVILMHPQSVATVSAFIADLM